MARKASLKTLLNRRIKDSDFPILIRRRLWASWLSAVLIPFLLGFAMLLLWMVATSIVPFGWGALFMILLAALFLIGCFVGLDGIGFSASVDRDGITIKGLLQTRFFSWDEITHFSTWRNPNRLLFYAIYQAVIHVDGTCQPKRLSNNLFFAGHFLPPFMEVDGKDIVKLLAKVKRHVEAVQTEQEP